MKRRLCVAIALIAHPRIVLLDEPSTGLDPARYDLRISSLRHSSLFAESLFRSRRKLWDVVEAYKANKRASILLTTHSMEEVPLSLPLPLPHPGPLIRTLLRPKLSAIVSAFLLAGN